MKKNVIIAAAFLALTSTLILFTGCNRPSERPSVVNSDIAANLFELKALPEITNSDAKAAKVVFYSSAENKEVGQLDASLKQMKIEGKTQALLNLVTMEATKKALDEHLKVGVVALVVLDDHIKILKVLSAEAAGELDAPVFSLTYLSKLKALVKTSDKRTQAILASSIESIKHKSLAQLNEKFGLVEITAIKIEKHGHLDNERTDYNEKKSLLNVIPAPFELSTHILVGAEVGSPAKEKTSEEASE